MRKGVVILQALAAAALWSAGDVRAEGCGHLVCGQGFVIDASTPACKVGQTCTVTFTLETSPDYHVNDEYPAKFVANDAGGVEFLGTDSKGKNYFTKGAGDFQKTDEKHAKLVVKFKPATKGTITIAGSYKFAVCTASNCSPTQVTPSVTVNVQ